MRTYQAYSTSPFTVTEFETACYVLIAVSLCRTLCVCVCVCYCLSLCSMSKWAESSEGHVPTVSTLLKVLHVRIGVPVHNSVCSTIYGDVKILAPPCGFSVQYNSHEYEYHCVFFQMCIWICWFQLQ